MNDNKRAIFTIAFVFILGFFLIRLKKDFNSSKNSSFEITEKEIMGHIQYLSHEDRKGRKPGTRESRDVIAYLIKELKSYGIKPGVKNQSYTQPFDIETGIELGENNFLTIKDMGSLMNIIKSQYMGVVDMGLVGKIAKTSLGK